MQGQLLNAKGEKVGQIELKDQIFGLKPVRSFLHEFVTVYESNQRRWTAHTKTRSDVSGGGKKPWKQKHTGRARAGSIRSPLWRHGGTTFGPRTGRVRLELPRRKARQALAQALAARHADGAIVYVDSLALQEPRTKEAAAVLKALGCQGRTLLVVEAADEKLSRASRNIPMVEVMLAADLNAYSVLRARRIVMTRPAVEKLGGRWS